MTAPVKTNVIFFFSYEKYGYSKTVNDEKLCHIYESLWAASNTHFLWVVYVSISERTAIWH